MASERSHPDVANRVGRLFFSKVARASAGLFFGGIAAGILGYIFQIIMGRMLSPQEYGLFSAMMALFTFFGAPLGTLMMVIARKVSEYRAREDGGNIAHFYYSINARTAVFGGAAVAAALLAGPRIQAYLKAPSIAPVYLLAALLFLNFLPIVNNAFLQGLQRFSWLSASGALAVMLKMVFAAALTALGYGVAGAVGGTIIATIGTWLITYGALREDLVKGKGRRFQTAHLSFRAALPALVANAAFAAMTQLDMVLVNYYFASHEAGLYAAASILGKAVMYLPGGIAMALFPMVAENRARDQSSAHLLGQSVVLTAVLCGAGAVFYFLFGEAIVVGLYGESYRDAGQVLKHFGFAILPMTLVLVAINFYIAEGRVFFAFLFVVAAPMQLLAIHLYHPSLQAVVSVLGLSGSVLAALTYGLLLPRVKRSA